jgi:predicted nucleic acid-binding protein
MYQLLPACRIRVYVTGICSSIVKILPCELRDLEQSWEYFRRGNLHKLSAVDATSFAIMKRARIRIACTFDHHFAVVGFRMVT